MPKDIRLRFYLAVVLVALGAGLLVAAERVAAVDMPALPPANLWLLAGGVAAVALGVAGLTHMGALARSVVEREMGERARDLSDELARTALLTRLSIELREQDDAPAIARDVLRVIAANTRADGASIILVRPDGAPDVAATIAGAAVQPIAPERARRVLERGLAGWALRHGRSVVCADLSHDDRWVSFGVAPDEGSAMALPLVYRRATLGVLTVVRGARDAFTSKDLLLLEGASAQASVALWAAQRYAEERLAREQSQLLLSMSQFVAAQRSSQDLARELLETCAAMFGPRASALFLASRAGEPELLSGQAGEPAERLLTRCMARVTALAGRALGSHEPVTELCAGAGPHGDDLMCVALPLLHSGSAIGVLVLLRDASGGAVFSARVWSTLTVFTGVAAATFANIQLIDRLELRASELEDLVAERTQQLQRSRDLLRIIFDGLADGLVLVGAEQTVLAANNAFCRGILGMHPKQVVGRRYPELLRDLEHSEYQVLERPPHGGSARVRSIDIAGQVRWYDLDSYALGRSYSGVELGVERWRDVTAEQALNDRLLLQEHLATLSRLAVSVVHEVGNPLQSVRSCLELCREGQELPAAVAEYLALADGELARIADLLEHLRELYRPPESIWGSVDLNGLAVAVRQATERQLTQRGQWLSLELDPRLRPVSGQPDALRQVLVSLVLVAHEALGPGAISLATYTDDARRESCIQVSDANRELSAEQRRRIAAALEHESPSGVGLGVALSRQVVQQHRGTLAVCDAGLALPGVTVSIPWYDGSARTAA